MAGLAALASSAEGIGRIYAAKQRQALSPLAVCVGDAFGVPRYAETGHLPRGCAQRLPLPSALQAPACGHVLAVWNYRALQRVGLWSAALCSSLCLIRDSGLLQAAAGAAARPGHRRAAATGGRAPGSRPQPWRRHHW